MNGIDGGTSSDQGGTHYVHEVTTSEPFRLPVNSKTGTFRLLNDDATGSDFNTPGSQGVFRSSVVPENTYYIARPASQSTVLATPDTHDVVEMYITGYGFTPVALFDRSAGTLRKLAASAVDYYTDVIENYITPETDTYQIFSELNDVSYTTGGVYLGFVFAANEVVASNVYLETYTQVIPFQDALVNYSANLNVETNVDSIVVRYRRTVAAYTYTWDGTLQENTGADAYLYGAATGYNDSGTLRLNIYPPEYAAVDSTAYQTGWVGNSSLTENALFLALALNLTLDRPVSDVVIEYKATQPNTYTPAPVLRSIWLPRTGALQADSLQLSYTVGNVLKTATSNAQGVISGEATGSFSARDFRIDFTLSALADGGAVTYQYTTDVESSSDGGGSALRMFYKEGVIILKDGATEELAIVNAVNDSGKTLALKTGLINSYPQGALVAGVVQLGDLYAQVGDIDPFQTFDTTNWVPSNEPNSLSYNAIDHPIEMANAGCVDEDWIIEMTSSSAFELRGRLRGVVASGDVSTDFAPDSGNGTPYFTLRAAGWGGTPQIAEGIAFRTFGTGALWVIRGTQYGSSFEGTDSVTMVYGGDN